MPILLYHLLMVSLALTTYPLRRFERASLPPRVLQTVAALITWLHEKTYACMSHRLYKGVTISFRTFSFQAERKKEKKKLPSRLILVSHSSENDKDRDFPARRNRAQLRHCWGRTRFSNCGREGYSASIFRNQRWSNKTRKRSKLYWWTSWRHYRRLSSRLFGSLHPVALGFKGFDPTETERYGDIFCQPRCSNPAIEYFETCNVSNGRSLADYSRQLCARNGRGYRCSSAVVMSSIQDAAEACPTGSCSSSSCRSALQTTTNRIGCCINLLDVDYIKDSCNIDVPEPCGGSALSAAHGILAGILAMLVTVMFQWRF